ncbi:MAG TPA: NAD(P)-binding domain-containing protein [Pyrinomonadaceae bacterium]|nr:NAD(P)-binding domain-containing protein [Pyrinomonadaceae bacterium]
MNRVQAIIAFVLLVLFLAVNQLAGASDTCARCYGGLPWYGWGMGFVVLFIAGLVFARWRGQRAHKMLAAPIATEAPAPEKEPSDDGVEQKWNEELRRKYDSDGPAFPHPVIVAERCIGCHACVESCPHDVLTISYTEDNQPVASVVDPELCAEDTSCEAACPVNPKACIVVNTAKQIKSLPTPERNPVTFETNVPGCYVIGDVSGTPLIKNAANEGATVMVHLAEELHTICAREGQPHVDYEVAIIGAGPAGLSAAIMAKRLGLEYVCIEQDTVMSTIVKYSKNKYVFFKPQTTAWTGAIHLPGLEEYVEEVLEEVAEEGERPSVARMLAEERAVAKRVEEKRARASRTGGKFELAPEDQLAPETKGTLEAARKRYQQLLADELHNKLDREASERLRRARARFETLLEGEDKYLLNQLLAARRAGQLKETDVRSKCRLGVAERRYGADLERIVEAEKLSDERFHALADARRKVAGDQREVLLNTWFLNARENCVRVNERESCKSVTAAEDGDYFQIQTERRKGKDEKRDASGTSRDASEASVKQSAEGAADRSKTYRVRRVVLAIGNSSSPTRFKVGGKEVTQKIKHGEEELDRVQYRVGDPSAFKQCRLIVVGGGNSAVEAAVDLVTWRADDRIEFRAPEEQNEVTLLVRGADFKTDVKFGNKQQLYRCIDRGLVRLRRQTEIKQVHDGEVVTKNLVTGKDDPPIKNDFIFALIGSERPAALLTKAKIKIVK